jgi:hypothetical protein
VVKDLVEQPYGGSRGDGRVETVFICRLGEMVCKVVNEAKTTCEFKLGYSPHMCMVLVMELDSKEVLE